MVLLVFLGAILAVGGVFVIVVLVVAARVHGPIQEAAFSSVAEAQIESFESELLDYSLSRGTFPTSEQGLEALFDDSRGKAKCEGPLPLDPWGQPYQYEFPGYRNEMRPDVWSMGPDMTDGTEDDIGNWQVPGSPIGEEDWAQELNGETEPPNRSRHF